VRYEAPKVATRDDLASALARGDDAATTSALLGLVYSDADWRWSQQQCIRLLDHRSSDVRGLAVTCLGHIARIYGDLDEDLVISAIQARESDPAVSHRAADVIDDIRTYLHRS
jgi:hypothetical protein